MINIDEDQRTRNATRYLCVGAYLDEAFRANVLRNILGQEYRAVAPSYSFDIGCVIRHCLAARRRVIQRDAAVTVVLLVALMISFWQLLSLLLLVQSVRMAFQALRRLDGDIPGAVRSGAIAVMLWVLSSLVGLSAMGSLAAGVTGMGAVEAFGLGMGRVLLSAVIGLAGTFVVFLAYRLQIHELILSELTEKRFRPGRAPAEPVKYRDRLAYLEAAQSGNVTMYARSQEARPFIGSGLIQPDSSWSIALPLIPNEESTNHFRATLTIAALYDLIRRALVTMADPQRPESERIGGLSLQDRLFVVGLLPPGHELVGEGGEPIYRVSRAQMLRLADQERNVATHYLTVRISAWNGELEVTVFLYFSIRGGMLYVEFLGAVLPPIRNHFHVVDSFERMSGKVVLRNIATALLQTPGALINSPVNLLGPVAETIWKQFDLRSQLQEISNRVAYDFGAVGSVREYGAEWNRSNMLHDLDAARHVQIVGRRLIDSLREALEAFGMSTEEFDERTKTIIDNSTRIENASFANSTVAVGTRARAGASEQTPSRGGRRQRAAPYSPANRNR